MRSAGYSSKTVMYRFIISLFALLLAACGSDSARFLPDTVTDTTAPSVIRTTPESEDTNHEVDTLPQILFSELVDLTSLEGSIKLYSGIVSNSDETEVDSFIERPVTYEVSTVLGEELEVNELTLEEIQVDATLVKIIPQGGRLSLRTPYTLEVTSKVHDLVQDNIRTEVDERNYASGEVIPFVTEAGVWVDPQAVPLRYLSDDGLSSIAHDKLSYAPDFVSTPSGDVIIVWRQVVEGVSQIWASRYLINEQAWVVPSDSSVSRHCRLNPLSSDPSCANSVRVDNVDNNAFSPSVAINDDGDVVVSWSQSDVSFGDTSIWVNLLRDGSWSGAAMVSNNNVINEIASEPRSLFVSGDDVLIVWFESSGGVKRLRSTLFDFSTAFSEQNFSAPIFIDSSAMVLGDASRLDYKANGNGTTFAWVQSVDGIFRIRSNRISANESGEFVWYGVEELDSLTGDGHTTDSPKVAASPSGAVTVAWRQSSTGRFDLFHSRLVGRAWSTPSKLEFDDRGSVTEIALEYDGHNKLFLAWTLQIDDGEELWTRVFHADTGWSIASQIELAANLAALPNVSGLTFSSFDLERNGSLMWIEGESTSVIRVVDYTHYTRTWSAPQSLNSSELGRIVDLTKHTLMRDGRMLAIWANEAEAQSVINSSVFMEYIAPIE